MKLGNIDPQVSIDYDTTEKIFETTVTGPAVTSIDITGLEGDTDEVYELDSNIKANGVTGTASLRFNGDSGTNYGFQYINGVNSTISASRNTEATTIQGYNLGTDGFVGASSYLIHAKSGYVRTVLNPRFDGSTGTTVSGCLQWGQSWNNTVDELTSITIFATGVGTFAVGSTISLYRKVSAA